MTRFRPTPFARDLQTLCRLGAVGGLGDGALLARFVGGAGDDRELAFAALIDRHGPMVLRVCQGVLKDRHDAEDAAQASFLILARRVRSIRRPGSLGPWLHGVALRTASRARAGAARRRDVERKAAEEVAMREQVDDRFAHDEELHEEIDRLPARYKAAIVACDLEGLTHAQASERLRLPVRTLETRLYRGRDRLRAKLVRRGVGLAAVEAALALGKPAEAALSASWKEVTARAAVGILEGASPVASGLVAERVFAWSQGLASGKIGSLAASAVALLASSGLLVGGAALASRKPAAADEPPPVAQAPIQPDRKDEPTRALVQPLPNPDEIKQILREAADSAIKLSREQPNPGSSALLAISSTQMTAGDRDGALKSLRAAEAETKGRKTGDLFRSWPFISAVHLVRMGLEEEGKRTLEEAAKEALDASDDRKKNNYDAVFRLAEIVKAQLRIGDAEHARENVKRVEKIATEALEGWAGERDGFFLGQLAGVQTAVGDLDGAFATLDRVTKIGPHAVENRAAILPLIAQEAKGLDARRARRVFDRLNKEIETLKSPEERWSIQRLLIGLLARLGDAAEARRFAQEVALQHDGGPIAVARRESGLLESMAYDQRAAGDRAGERESFRLAFEAIRGQAKTKEGADRCRRLGMSQALAGDLDGALRAVEALDAGQEMGVVFPMAAWRLAVEGKSDRALEMLRKARADLEATWKDLPADQSKALAVDASRTIDAMVQTAAVEALAGDVEGAVAAARRIPDGGWRRQALARVVESLARAGDLRGALKLALSFDAPDDRRLALDYLGTGLSGRLNIEEQLKEPDHVKPKGDR